MSAPIAEVVHAYLAERGVPFEADASGVVSFPAVATNGSWSVFVNPREDADILVVHSLVGDLVPADRRPAVMVFVTRANFGLLVGNFELDLDDGELRYKTSIDLAGTTLTPTVVDRLLLANVAVTDRYLPGIRAVLAGADPAKAVAEAEVEVEAG